MVIPSERSECEPSLPPIMTEQLQHTSNVNQKFGNITASDGTSVSQGIFNVQGDLHMNSPGRQSQSLDTATEARHDAASKEHIPSCLENTRVDVLSKIQGWIDGDGERRLYWLKGMAGTGKSTIALTIARNYAMHKRPSASFFFSRGGGDLASANKFVVTIAAQLSRTVTGFQKHLDHALATNRDVLGTGIYNQWETLVIEPLKQLSNDGFTCPIVIIVDALDECDDDRDVAVLIKCFQDAAAIEHAPVRIFVTSRPESAINHEFTNVPRDMRQDLVLHNIEDSIVNEDLHLYYQYRLKNTAHRFDLDDVVYSDHTVEILVKSSHCLFIYAATVCRFIEETKEFADRRLSLILNSKHPLLQPEKELDNMYTKVLNHSWPTASQLESQERTERKDSFSRIAGSIVVLHDVLSIVDLALILSKSVDQVRRVLQSFHSVLDVPEDESKPIRLLHPSFRDFLLDPARCQTEIFSIDPKEIHGRLFHDCLLLMKDHLRRNMCKLDHPGTRAYDVHKADVDKFIPSSVQYACRYWLYHLQQHGFEFSADTCQELEKFFSTSFLYWLETLSLLHRFSEAVAMIRLLGTRLPPSTSSRSSSSSTSGFSETKTQEKDKERNAIHTPSLEETVHDATRFLLANAAIIEEAPLQIYCSALVFSPQTSIIRMLYSSDQIPSWVSSHLVTRKDWAPYVRTLVNQVRVNSIAFSPDSQLLATGSWDGTIQLWNAVTGRKVRTMQGHVLNAADYNSDEELFQGKKGINIIVVFSPNSRLLASGSKDGTIQIWDVITGKEQCAIKGHSGDLKAIVFSPDSRLLASGSSDGTIHILNASTGEKERAIKDTCLDWIMAVALVRDSHLDIMAENNKTETVRIWRKAPSYLQRIGLKPDWNDAIAISPDFRLAAVDKGIHENIGIFQLWDVVDRKKVHSLRNHVYSSPTAVAFSPDSGLVAAGLRDITVRLWDTATGKTKGILDVGTTSFEDRYWAAHDSRNDGLSTLISCVAFSPGDYLASASEYGLVRIWDTAADQLQREVERPLQCQFTFVVDCRTIVGFLMGGTVDRFLNRGDIVKIWDVATNTKRHTLSIPLSFGPIRSIQLSPNARWMAVDFLGGTIIYETATGKRSCVISKRSHLIRFTFASKGRHISQFSSDSRRLVFFDFDSIEIWNVESGQKQHRFRQPWPCADLDSAVAISPNGRWLGVKDHNGAVLWDAATGVKMLTLLPNPGKREPGDPIAFSPNNNLIAVGFEGIIVVWNVITGEKQRILTSEDDGFCYWRKITFSPDSRLVVSSHEQLKDGSSWTIWNVDSGRRLYKLQDVSRDFELPVAISPDSQHVIFSTSHGIICWERATGQEQCLHSEEVPCCKLLSVSPCGKHIVTNRGTLPSLPSSSQSIPYLFASKSWIQKDGRDLLYIHPDYQNDVAFVAGNCVFFKNARDSILQIDTSSDFKVE